MSSTTLVSKPCQERPAVDDMAVPGRTIEEPNKKLPQEDILADGIGAPNPLLYPSIQKNNERKAPDHRPSPKVTPNKRTRQEDDDCEVIFVSERRRKLPRSPCTINANEIQLWPMIALFTGLLSKPKGDVTARATSIGC